MVYNEKDQLTYLDVSTNAGHNLLKLRRLAIAPIERSMIHKIENGGYFVHCGATADRHDHMLVFMSASLYHRIIATLPKVTMQSIEQSLQDNYYKMRQTSDWSLLEPVLYKSLESYWRLATRCYAVNLALYDAWGLNKMVISFIMHTKGLSSSEAVLFLDYHLVKTYIDVAREGTLEKFVVQYLKDKYTTKLFTKGRSAEQWSKDARFNQGIIKEQIAKWTERVRKIAMTQGDTYIKYADSVIRDHENETDDCIQNMIDHFTKDGHIWLLPKGSNE